MTCLHLIRHGRASAMDAEYDKLQPLGERQARLLGEHLGARGQRFDRIFVGPLRRQQETLRLMREAAGDTGASWPEAITLAGLEEAPYEPLLREHLPPRLGLDPQIDGLVAAITAAADTDARHAAMFAIFDYMVGLWRAGEVAPELQTYGAFEAAVMGAYGEIVKLAARDEQVAVITSNGVIGCVLECAAGLELPEGQRTVQLVNTSTTLLEIDGARAVLRAQNVTEHLREAELLTIV